MTTTKQGLKRVLAAHPAPPLHWVGNGFPVRSLFSYNDSPAVISPFLLLDYAAPRVFAPAATGRRGVGEHPHRGFETVTLAFQGEIEHRDSAGHAGRIGPGDVQWMTAASGIVHEEMHGRAFMERGGPLEMVQLWVNLPARDKMCAPGYQDLLSTRIPTVALPAGTGSLRTIAGDFEGARGPARTFTPIQVWDMTLVAGGTLQAGVPAGHGVAVLVLRGSVKLQGEATLGESGLAFLDRRGDQVSIEALADSKVLLLAGAPIDEPVVGYGPFVMNSRAEIGQAIEDYQTGKMGSLS
jgi:redox-sensitive bicupin YhaK (pirin superfamily)